MTVYHGSSDRFLRPVEIGPTPRNLRRLQARKLLLISTNVLMVSLIVLGAFWAWRKTRDDARFGIRQIEVAGLHHAPRTEIEAVASRWKGANLFRLDHETVRAELRSHPWVESVSVEKKLPATLHIEIAERTPAALVVTDGAIRYVDRHGIVFAALSPRIGDPDLPLVSGADQSGIASAVEFLESVEREHPELYSRVSEIEAIPGEGFAVWDRELRTLVRLGPEGASRWLALHALVRADGWPAGSLEYADLRFRGRVVIKPLAESSVAVRSGGLL